MLSLSMDRRLVDYIWQINTTIVREHQHIEKDFDFCQNFTTTYTNSAHTFLSTWRNENTIILCAYTAIHKSLNMYLRMGIGAD